MSRTFGRHYCVINYFQETANSETSPGSPVNSSARSCSDGYLQYISFFLFRRDVLNSDSRYI